MPSDRSRRQDGLGGSGIGIRTIFELLSVEGESTIGDVYDKFFERLEEVTYSLGSENK